MISRIKEYKLLEAEENNTNKKDINTSTGAKVSFIMSIELSDDMTKIDDNKLKEEIIKTCNAITQKINNKNTTVITQSLNSNTATFTGNAEQNGRYNLTIDSSLDESSIKYNRKDNVVTTVFALNISVTSKKTLKKDMALKAAATLLKGATATNTSALGGGAA